MSREWYTDREWERIVGWGKVPKEYQKPEYIHNVHDFRDDMHYESWDKLVKKLQKSSGQHEKEEFDYKKKNPHESWDMFLVRKLRERRQHEETINERHSTNKVQRWYSKIFKWGRRK